MVLLVSLGACAAYAMDGDGKELTMEDINAIAANWQKNGVFDLSGGTALTLMAESIAAREAQKQKALLPQAPSQAKITQSTSESYDFFRTRYNH